MSETWLVYFAEIRGLGNDRLYVDKSKYKEEHDWSALTRAVAGRCFGVRWNGIMAIEPLEVADFKVWMINAEGLEREMCGRD